MRYQALNTRRNKIFSFLYEQKAYKKLNVFSFIMYLVLGSVIRHWKSSTRVFIGLELRGGKLQKKTFSNGGFACLRFLLKFLDII